MANRKPRSQPWTNGKVTFAFHEDGTLSLRREEASDDAAALFDPSQQSELKAIFAEMHKINRAVRSSSLWLRSDEKGEDGFYVGVPAELETTYEDKKTGETKTRAFAYVAEQLEDFKPVAFAIKARWDGYKLVPVLHAYAAVSGSRASGRSDFKRTINVEREQANGGKKEQPQYHRSK